MNWLAGLILDHVPWWLWAVGIALLLAATWSWWLPLWLRLPSPFRAALLILGTGGLAYLAGRNRGAAGALQRARDQEQARADDIADMGRKARLRAGRDADAGRLRDDDGWRRHDG